MAGEEPGEEELGLQREDRHADSGQSGVCRAGRGKMGRRRSGAWIYGLGQVEGEGAIKSLGWQRVKRSPWV